MTFFEYLSYFLTFGGNTKLWHNKKDKSSTFNEEMSITTSAPWQQCTTISPRTRLGFPTAPSATTDCPPKSRIETRKPVLSSVSAC